MRRTRSDFERARLADVVHEVRAGASIDLSTFLQALPGYWPVDVVEDLRAMRASAVPSEAARIGLLLKQLELPARDPDLGDEVRRVLPVPHPLDADWRFTVRTRELLLELADSHSPRRETLLLGTPSIFAHMCAQLDLRAAVLVDANAATIAAANSLAAEHDLLRAQHADLMTQGDVGLDPVFDTVIADPPWYFAEHRSFLDAAAALLVPAGVVLMAAAPRGTRAGADSDRTELLIHADSAGFDLIETHLGALEYTSSPFERAALRESGLPSIPTHWRKADLLVFRKAARPSANALVESLRPANWVDRSQRRIRLKLHLGNTPASSDHDQFSGSVSASVSRLAPERATANLWTSGNGAFNVNESLMRAILDGDDQWRGSGAGAALTQILEGEAADLRRWGWE